MTSRAKPMPPTSSRVSLTPVTFHGVAAERGTLRAPVRHADPGGPSLELRFVRLPRLAGAGGAPLVFLTGGPGLSGVRSGEGRLFAMFDALRAHGDVILLDQRACAANEIVARAPVPEYPSHEAVMREEYLRVIHASVRNGVDSLAAHGLPVHALNTNESADDVALLIRECYGADASMALLGWSYGSHLAMAVMKRHPTSVARVILAAPEGPDQTLKYPRAVQDHIERLSRRASVDLVAALSRALDRAERDTPVVPMVADRRSRTSAERERRLGRFDLTWIVSELAADTRALRHLPAWLSRMANGDFACVGEERLLVGAWDALRHELPLGAARYAMDCASGATAARRARIEREARVTLLGNAIDFPLPDICDALGCPDLGDEFRSSPRSNAPVLFITGTLDCRTPAENLDELTPGLSNHRHLVVEDAGHGDLLLASRVQGAINRFVAGDDPGNARVGIDARFEFESS